MAIQTACPHCDRAYTLSDELDGKTVKCKGCEQRFVVQPLTHKKAKAVAVTPAPSKKKAPARDDDTDDEADDRPSRKFAKKAKTKKKRAQANPMVWVLAVGIPVLLIGVGIGLYFLLKGGGPPARVNDQAKGGGPPARVNDQAKGGGPLTRINEEVKGGGPPARVNEEAFDQLRTGMTEQEVLAVIGPATRRQVGPDGPEQQPVIAGPGITVVDLVKLHWLSGKNKIEVSFDVNGKAFWGKAEFEDGPEGYKAVSGNQFDQLDPSGRQTIWYKRPDGNFRPPPKLPAVLPGPSKITLDKTLKVTKGMTGDQVAQALGEQPTKKLGPQLMPNGTLSADTWQWTNGNGFFKVHFDADKKVIGTRHKDLPVF